MLSHKKYLLVIWKVLEMFVNILTADVTYFLLIRDNLRQPIQMQSSQKQKVFSQHFSQIFESKFDFEHLQRKMTITADMIPKLRTRRLNKSLKSPFSEEDPLISNMALRKKHCSNLNHTSFNIFFDQCEGN